MSSILQRFRKFDFTKSLLRPLQCSSVVGLRTISDPVVINNYQASGQICFDDGKELFTSKKTRDILRGIFVLKLCSYDAVAKNSMVLMASGRKLLGQTLFEFVLRKTLYSQFVAGEALSDIQQNIKELRECGIGTMLFVPTEEDISTDYSDFKSREHIFDKNAASILECIARTEDKGFSQMKITAVCSPMLLDELNQHLSPYKTRADKPVELDVENFARGYSEKIKLSVLTDNQNEHLCNVFKRLDSLAKECVKRNVTLVIDAEQTYLQAAINHLVLTLQYKYNKEYPWVYNTYQGYRKDTYDVLKADLEVMDKLGYQFGGKVVRGAYMETERTRAAEMGYDDPINNSYEDTNNMYNKVIDTLLQRVKDMSAQVMIASHNEESVTLAINRMRQLGIQPQDTKVSFGQIYGMCDQISYMLGQQGYRVYKSMPYGPVEHVLAYLARRANENRDVLKRTEKERYLLWQELKRRIGLAQ